ncbi:DgyrCDS552 [Dimorphilus gyrociliatus]|uniref:DgyrCDS552 n=1 Tax=Dimorphilus gyrociliatus TaxID=2664684 RepID=A0A7I8V9F7_9ANNE|nr:DgyrCDS552 [Dimorphilus gyrociliatus]
MENSTELRSLAEFEERAKEKLSSDLYFSFYGDTNNGKVVERNKFALERLLLCPNICKDVTNRNMELKLFKESFPFPLGISPTASHELVHPSGELATAKAAESLGIPYVISMFSNVAIENIVKSTVNGFHLAQIQFIKDKNATFDLMKRFERAGVKGFVITIDMPVLHPNKPYSQKLRLKNPQPNSLRQIFADDEMLIVNGSAFDGSYTWEDVKQFKQKTNLPVIVKGILTPQNAIEAINSGVSAIWISNHGGRQMSDCPPTVEALEIISPVVKRYGIPLFIDGGIRSGSDVLKCLALGADMVFLGRPVISGLVVNGIQGIIDTFHILTKDLDANMAMCETGEAVEASA